MTEGRYVSTARVAAALGVSVTSVKRWVDEGILAARKTVGGHRKVLLADVLRLVRESRFPHQDLALLGLPRVSGSALDVPALLEDLGRAFRQGDGDAVQRVIRGAYDAGMPLAELGDQVVGPAMTQIGIDWQEGRIDVLYEHRATQLCLRALYELQAQLLSQDRSGWPVAVGGAPEGDPTIIPALLAQLVLLDAGWDAINLGPHTPAASLRQALDEWRPRLLWLSVCHPPEDAERFLRDYGALVAACSDRQTAVALGGRGLTETLRAGLPATTIGAGLTELAAFARSLHQPPRRPTRGRPPRKPAPPEE